MFWHFMDVWRLGNVTRKVLFRLVIRRLLKNSKLYTDCLIC